MAAEKRKGNTGNYFDNECEFLMKIVSQLLMDPKQWYQVTHLIVFHTFHIDHVYYNMQVKFKDNSIARPNCFERDPLMDLWQILLML